MVNIEIEKKNKKNLDKDRLLYYGLRKGVSSPYKQCYLDILDQRNYKMGLFLDPCSSSSASKTSYAAIDSNKLQRPKFTTA